MGGDRHKAGFALADQPQLLPRHRLDVLVGIQVIAQSFQPPVTLFHLLHLAGQSRFTVTQLLGVYRAEAGRQEEIEDNARGDKKNQTRRS